MSDLVSIAFPTEAAAEEVRKKLLDIQQEYLIELGDAVIAVKQPNGGVKLNQLFHPTAAGAATGAFWGTLIGLIFLMPLAGAVVTWPAAFPLVQPPENAFVRKSRAINWPLLVADNGYVVSDTSSPIPEPAPP